MITIEHLEESVQKKLRPWLNSLPAFIEQAFDVTRFGDLPKWKKACDLLPDLKPSVIKLDSAVITVGKKEDADYACRKELEKQLRILHPWRKGPFSLFGVYIDTEWRSDFKWERLQKHISPLKDKTVLDIGCGNGYHCLRMAGEGAGLTIGIDPMIVYSMQFQALQKYIRNESVKLLPVSDAQLPERADIFDTVFSMGVLYHQKSPFDHLQKIYSLLKSGGEAVLETLIIDGGPGQALVPEDRYAQMRNVWFLPSALTLESWMKKTGFKNIQLVDVNQTSTEEQRSTSWMTFQSLKDYLDPADSDKTVEGYPAPKRAILIANK